jgi:hypothetical protein
MIKQTENEVEADVVGWLRKSGWIVRRQHVGCYYTVDGRTVRIGEVGQCDWLAMRHFGRGSAEVLEFEAKRTGAKPSKAQREYMAKQNRGSFVCICADSLESFIARYQESFGADS